MHLGPSKHSFQGGFLYNIGAFSADYFVIFRRGWALFTLDIRIGIAVAGSTPPYLDRIAAAEGVNGREK
jgi:hypothetical protein